MLKACFFCRFFNFASYYLKFTCFIEVFSAENCFNGEPKAFLDFGTLLVRKNIQY